MTKRFGKIVVDLDGTAVGPKRPGRDYDSCRPNGRLVQRLRELKQLGFEIAIYTARNVRTHQHNPGLLAADTVPKIVSYLREHDIPFDEVHVGKPWTGEVGFYVDDRAIRPDELVSHTIPELVELTRGSRYDPYGNLARRGSEQGWVVVDVRACCLTLDSTALLDFIRDARDHGWRTALLIPANGALLPGVDEEYRRLGVRLARSSDGPLLRAAGIAVADLISDGLAGPRSPVTVCASLPSSIEVVGDATERLQRSETRQVKSLLTSALTSASSLAAHTQRVDLTSVPMAYARVTYGDDETVRVLKSRHFNRVRLVNGEVLKSGQTPEAQKKLELERLWLFANGDISAEGLAPTADGYALSYAAGGSLDRRLLRTPLAEWQLENITEDLWDLMNSLAARAHAFDLDEACDEHDELICGKSRQRLAELEVALQREASLSTYGSWVVNGDPIGPPTAVVESLLEFIPYPSGADWGGWHGDLCPGNIVLQQTVTGPQQRGLGMRLIDPRGTRDGKTLALCGDVRYDHAKLAHALRWGYDALVEGWRDCDWQRDGAGVFDVRLEVWDERVADGAGTNRRRLWDLLTRRAPHLDRPVIHALAALQLITCAPLHREDPERMVALVARGLQAAKFALSQQ